MVEELLDALEHEEETDVINNDEETENDIVGRFFRTTISEKKDHEATW